MDIPRPDNFNECYLYEGTDAPLSCPLLPSPALLSPALPANNAPRPSHEQC